MMGTFLLRLLKTFVFSKFFSKCFVCLKKKKKISCLPVVRKQKAKEDQSEYMAGQKTKWDPRLVIQEKERKRGLPACRWPAAKCASSQTLARLQCADQVPCCF